MNALQQPAQQTPLTAADAAQMIAGSVLGSAALLAIAVVAKGAIGTFGAIIFGFAAMPAGSLFQVAGWQGVAIMAVSCGLGALINARKSRDSEAPEHRFYYDKVARGFVWAIAMLAVSSSCATLAHFMFKNLSF